VQNEATTKPQSNVEEEMGGNGRRMLSLVESPAKTRRDDVADHVNHLGRHSRHSRMHTLEDAADSWIIIGSHIINRYVGVTVEYMRCSTGKYTYFNRNVSPFLSTPR